MALFFVLLGALRAHDYNDLLLPLKARMKRLSAVDPVALLAAIHVCTSVGAFYSRLLMAARSHFCLSTALLSRQNRLRRE